MVMTIPIWLFFLYGAGMAFLWYFLGWSHGWSKGRLAMAWMRRALHDAVANCSECGGHGMRYLPGGTIACSRCSYWRRVLAEGQ